MEMKLRKHPNAASTTAKGRWVIEKPEPSEKPKPIKKPKPAKKPRKWPAGRRRINLDGEELYERHSNGETYDALAKEKGVGYSTIRTRIKEYEAGL